MTGQSLINAVRDQGGFDNARTDVLEWLNQRYSELVARARYRLAEQTLTTTVAGQAAYDLPATVVDVEDLKTTGADGVAHGYERMGERDIWRAQRSELSTRGAFASYYKDDGTQQIQLFPAPTTTGDVITVLAALYPGALTDDATSTPIIPVDLHSAIRDGAISWGLMLMDERQDLAAGYEQRFEVAVLKLQRRKNSRIGAGPFQMQVQGVHF